MTDRNKPKTVAELIAELEQYPKTMRVMVNGYEGGFHDVGEATTINVALNINTEWYYGPHELWDEDMHGPYNKEHVLLIR